MALRSMATVGRADNARLKAGQRRRTPETMMKQSLYQRALIFLKNEEGQDGVEYALLVVFVVFLIMLGPLAFGREMRAIYDQVVQAVQSGLAGW
jgi:Flp pilus assembly pilin Flp